MDKRDFELYHWRYYEILERDFFHILEYVEFTESNFETYSLKISNLLMSICSEMEAVFKIICDLKDKGNIGIYRKEVIVLFPEILDQKIKFKLFDIEITPFKGWTEENPGESLNFWDAYNGSKHNRRDEFKKSNLLNTASALAALHILEMYYYDYIYKRDRSMISNYPTDGEQNSRLTICNWKFRVRESLINNLTEDLIITD